MLGLIETKKDVITKFDVVQFWDNDAVSLEFVGSEGASGSLLIMWDDMIFRLSNYYKGERWLYIEGELINNNFQDLDPLNFEFHFRE
ncbi:hypothetical protein AHAS_Ahas12G0202600 [Arachis hypogaea]